MMTRPLRAKCVQLLVDFARNLRMPGEIQAKIDRFRQKILAEVKGFSESIDAKT